jgi:hypothetical protein
MPYYGGTPMAADPQMLMDRLMKNGYSRAQAAAILGNLQRESGLHSNNVNKDEGAYGLMQWRGDRFAALQQFAAARKVPWTDPATQADFIAHEMQTTERKNAAPFMAATTVDEASAALKPVIRYGDKSGPERAMHARNFFGQPGSDQNVFGAQPSAPQTPAVASGPPGPSAPPEAQPAVSRETQRQLQQQYYDDYRDRSGSNQRGLRGGISSLGDLGAAFIQRNRRDTAAGNPTMLDRLGQTLQNASSFPQQAPAASAPPVDRGALAATVVGQPPAVDLTSRNPAATAPPGAPDPPRFPGGVPQPRPRPQTGPGMMEGDAIIPRDALASLVDPRTGYDYG